MTEVRGYHAHVYYDAATKPTAARLRKMITEKFSVEPRDLSDEPRGPHPISQFAVVFRTEEFQSRRAVADVEPRGPRRSRSPADRKLLRRPQQECAVARDPGADAPRCPAPDLSRRAVSGRRRPFGVTPQSTAFEGPYQPGEFLVEQRVVRHVPERETARPRSRSGSTTLSGEFGPFVVGRGYVNRCLACALRSSPPRSRQGGKAVSAGVGAGRFGKLYRPDDVSPGIAASGCSYGGTDGGSWPNRRTREQRGTRREDA